MVRGIGRNLRLRLGFVKGGNSSQSTQLRRAREKAFWSALLTSLLRSVGPAFIEAFTFKFLINRNSESGVFPTLLRFEVAAATPISRGFISNSHVVVY